MVFLLQTENASIWRFFYDAFCGLRNRTMHPALYKSKQSERETALLNANTTRGKLHGSSLVMGNKA
ncbi:hypothetical protein CIAN88_21210 [[Clostridium] innocuum]|uniref:Uncharacterized protein n=1 Tax=Clostridium innocuum TaxID=1522 RepID=A0A099I381_CLOIN|nr:hypothetical protein CIAN88_21210 [[Clostridium] innocuum]